MSTTSSRVGVILVTYHPQLVLLRAAIGAVGTQVVTGVVVDNASPSVNEIRNELLPHFRLISNPRNEGTAKALNQGVAALLADPEITHILTLDQDTVLEPSYVDRLLAALSDDPLPDRVGIISAALFGESGLTGQLLSVEYAITTGNLVRASLFAELRYREEFFVDQVDHDFCSRVRAAGYRIVVVDRPMFTHIYGSVTHRLGRLMHYEPRARYYLMARNSTVLLREGRISARFYLRQLSQWGIPLAFAEGLGASGSSLVRGVGDALGGRLGAPRCK